MSHLSFPIFITNAKNYPQVAGDALPALLFAHEHVAQESGKAVGVAVGAIQLSFAADLVHVPVLAQHADASAAGSTTGAILPEMIVWSGAAGTLLNHSENRIENIEATIVRCREAKLPVILCAESPEEVAAFAQLKPDAIAYEPPELIGSTTQSVATAKPEYISKAVKAAGNVPLLVGAGIKTPEDIKVSMDLGAQGFLVASGIIKAENPEQALRELVAEM